MYAIVETGGKQYKVSTNDLVEVELIDAEIGSKVNLKTLMIVEDGKVTTGNPYLQKDCIAEVVSHGKGKKLNIFKYKAKKNVRRRQGHRQPFTTLKILEVK